MAKKGRRPRQKGDRLDALLVARGLAPDLPKARALIMAGQVIAQERRVDRADARFPPDAPLRLKGQAAHPFVSRGGLKLAGALDHFSLDVTDLTCLDLGASTGGFTDALLQRGARRVYAVDVGHNQLAWSLRQDDRVISLERTHAKDLTATLIPDPIDLLVADVSFTSLARVLPPAVALLAPEAHLIALVKPQFEVQPSEVGEGGLVTDPALHERVIHEVRQEVEALGLAPLGVVASSITGSTGNQEYLMGARRAFG